VTTSTKCADCGAPAVLRCDTTDPAEEFWLCVACAQRRVQENAHLTEADIEMTEFREKGGKLS
jgi:hypothetical protein